MTTTEQPNPPIVFEGIDLAELANVLHRGVDHGGNIVHEFDGSSGGWPMRCCLRNSHVGERIALVAWSPFPWEGPYRETGPIFVHLDGCEGWRASSVLPEDLDQRPMVLRPYGHDQRIAYPLVRHLPEGSSITGEIAQMLADPEVDFVHGRNVTGGCFSFTARRISNH